MKPKKKIDNYKIASDKAKQYCIDNNLDKNKIDDLEMIYINDNTIIFVKYEVKCNEAQGLLEDIDTQPTAVLVAVINDNKCIINMTKDTNRILK